MSTVFTLVCLLTIFQLLIEIIKYSQAIEIAF